MRYFINSSDFNKLPNCNLAYWVSPNVIEAYKSSNLDSLAQPRHGLATSDNNRFLKLWFEVSVIKISLDIFPNYDKKWFPMNKGGQYRKWYGNNEWVINYENDGEEIKEYAISLYKCSSRTIQNTQFYFKKGITWSALTSGEFSVRYTPGGYLFGSGGYCAFAADDTLFWILALLNNKVNKEFMGIVSPTLNFEVGHIKTIPVVIEESKKIDVNDIVLDNINISKEDWDSFETSWEFKKHPLI